MARLPRLEVPGWPHLLVQRAHTGQMLAVDDEDRRALLECIRQSAAHCGVQIHAWALEDERFMLLATPQTEGALGALMQGIGRQYVAAYNRRHARAGGLWAARFRGTVIDPARNLLYAMVYVESRGLPWDEALAGWSSAGHHLGRQVQTWLVDPPAFWALGNTPFERQAGWRRCLEEGLGSAILAQITQAMHKGWAWIDPQQAVELERLSGRPVLPRPRGRPSGSRRAREGRDAGSGGPNHDVAQEGPAA